PGVPVLGHSDHWWPRQLLAPAGRWSGFGDRGWYPRHPCPIAVAGRLGRQRDQRLLVVIWAIAPRAGPEGLAYLSSWHRPSCRRSHSAGRAERVPAHRTGSGRVVSALPPVGTERDAPAGTRCH